MIIWAINESLYPYFVRVLVNDIEKLQPGIESPFYALAFPLGALVISWLITELMMRSLGIVMMYVWPKFRKNIREETFNYTQGHSHSFFTDNFAGNIANKISELPRACQQILDTFITSFFAILLTFFISLIIIYQVNPIFGHILLVWVILFLILTFMYVGRINRSSEIHAEAIAVLNGQVVDSLSSMMMVQIFARARHELNHLGKYQDIEIKKSRRASWVIEELNIIRGILSFTFVIIMFSTLVYSWNQKQVTLGDISLIAISSFNLMGLVWRCAYNITYVVKEIGVVQAAFSLTSKVHDIQDAPDAKALQIKRGEIVFNQVTFQYDKNSSIFKNQTVKIEAGQKVGLVGFSGSGKSTFVNLIMRFYDIDQGRILIDGQDISQVTRNSLRQQIAMIPQEPALFHRTIMENIRYGRLDATDEEVYEAARRAHCDEFIRHMEEGYQTIVGEKGSKLSGGQRQRIAIACAILKGAPIIILV
ncbi:MAG: ABC transporter ATP-binding protein [Janthinobacterium lividum]